MGKLLDLQAVCFLNLPSHTHKRFHSQNLGNFFDKWEISNHGTGEIGIEPT